MANPDHISWISEGVDKWNARRRRVPFVPDFSGAKGTLVYVTGLVLDGADLSDANFDGSPQLGVDFRGANLSDASFAGALLSGARFHRSILTNANFADAYLTGFTGSVVMGQPTHFDPANLTDATLTGANFVRANLTGAVLGGSKLWESILFPQHRVLEQYDIGADRLTNIAGLMQAIKVLNQKYAEDCPSENVLLYFRGESKSAEASQEWVLSPAVKRGGFADFEGAMLTELMASHPEEFAGSPSALSQWVLAQHHSLKTRFLDVTKNPLVGLYFACEEDAECDGNLHVFAVPGAMVKPFNSDTVSIISNFARLPSSDQEMLLGKVANSSAKVGEDYPSIMGKLYQLIQEEKPGFEKRIDPRDFYRVVVIEPQLSSARVRAQSGAMLASAFHERFERSLLEQIENVSVYGHYTLTIPSGDVKRNIAEELHLLQIRRPNLFPSLDETSVEITQRYGTQLQRIS